MPMNTIARLAGVGVGTVYRHFPTRQALLESVAAESLTHVVRETKLAAAEADPAVGLERALRATLECQLADLGLAAVLAAPQFECVETLDLGAALLESVTLLLDRARHAQLIRPGIHADDIRRLLCGVVYAIRCGPDGPDVADRYLQVLLDGLRPA